LIKAAGWISIEAVINRTKVPGTKEDADEKNSDEALKN